MFLASCDEAALSSLSLNSSPENPALLSSEERQLRAVERNRAAQATAIGCLSGAALGALSDPGRLTQGNVLERLRNVAVGTGVGCIAGFAAGSYINARSRNYATQQDAYRAAIAAADRDIAQYRSLNGTAQRLIAQQQSKIRSLNTQYAAGQVTRDQYRQQIASADNNVANLRRQVQNVDSQIRAMRADEAVYRQSNRDTSQLRNRIATLEAQKAQLERSAASLVNIYSVVPPEVNRGTL